MRGFLDARKKVEEMRKKYPPKPGAKPRTFFTSFTRGMQVLTDGMADAAGRERITTGKGVERIERAEDGAWLVTFEDGSTDTGDAVIVATESWAAEKIVRGVDNDITVALSGIPSSSSATVSMAFEEEGFGVDTNAFGVLCPLVENRALMAATFSSTKWPGRAPAGNGADARLRRRSAQPGDHGEVGRGTRRDRAQGASGHHRRAEGRQAAVPARVPLASGHAAVHHGPPRPGRRPSRSAAPRFPGLALAGGGYRGVGLPNCIEGGERGVTKVLGEWGIELDEDHVEEKRAY